MKKILIILSLASLCMSALGSDNSIICKLKVKRKDAKSEESKANLIGKVGKVRVAIKGDSQLEILVSKISYIHSKKEIEYNEEESASLSKELLNQKVRRFTFGSVKATKALSTNNYFVYLNKAGALTNDIEAEVIDRQTGERALLDKCQQPGNFFSRLLKQ